MNPLWILLLSAGFFAGFAVPHRPIDRFGQVLAAVTVALMIAGAFVLQAVMAP